MGCSYPNFYPGVSKNDFIGQQKYIRQEMNVTPQRVNLKERRDDSFEVINSEQEWLEVIRDR